MSNKQYEIEIKSLLGTTENALAFKDRVKGLHPEAVFGQVETQLNHYFQGGDPSLLFAKIAPLLPEAEQEQFKRIVSDATTISVRTREAKGVARFIIKASMGSDSSANGVARAEVDVAVPDLSLTELDALVLATGYTYQAKWSRSRETAEAAGITICLDKNAGYGYLVEFERVIDDESKIEETTSELKVFMETLHSEELPQDRLERMFTYYNEHWPEYYGTDKVFNIE